MKAKKLIASVMFLLMVTSSLSSCIGNTRIDIDSVPSIANTSSAVSVETSEIEPPTETGYTERPFATEIINKTADHIVIAGTCEEGASVIIKGGKEDVTVQSAGGYYIAEVVLATSGSNRLEMTAKVENKEESTVRVISAQYKATVSDRPDDNGVIVGLNSQLFLKKTLDDLNGKNLMSMSEIADLKALANKNYDAIQAKRIADIAKETGKTDDEVKASYNPIQVIYVLVPDAITVYPELVPEQYVVKTNTTRYDQMVKALSSDGVNAKVIDLKKVLTSHKNDGYVLYSRTDSHWSDYAAYFAYAEVCNIIDDRFPQAAARPLTDFTIENKTVYGGDMADYVYLNRETTKDTTTILTPKFEYSFPTGTFYSKEKPEDRTYVNNEKDTDYGLGVRRIIKTEREGLPNVMIYRDISVTPIYNMLADRFSMTVFHTLAEAVTKTAEAGPDTNFLKPRKVDIGLKPAPDYVVIFCTETNLDILLNSAMQ